MSLFFWSFVYFWIFGVFTKGYFYPKNGYFFIVVIMILHYLEPWEMPSFLKTLICWNQIYHQPKKRNCYEINWLPTPLFQHAWIGIIHFCFCRMPCTPQRSPPWTQSRAWRIGNGVPKWFVRKWTWGDANASITIRRLKYWTKISMVFWIPEIIGL